jgi:anthranilate phosphoribosyltransferase
MSKPVRPASPKSPLSDVDSAPFLRLLHGQLSSADAIALLSTLTPDQLTANRFGQLLATIQSQCAVEAPLDLGPNVLDCCGTGGTGRPDTFNTSTAIAFVLAAGGVKVAKFGNRSATSASGSSDFLEALRIPLSLRVESLSAVFDETGLLFLFAPQFYPALAGLAPLRKQFSQQTGLPTAFNFMGPLLNPVRLDYRLLGVSNPQMASIMTETLSHDTQLQHAWVVQTESGDDEIGVTEPTLVWQIAQQQCHEWVMPSATHATQPTTPPPVPVTPATNAQMFLAMMNADDTQSLAYHQICRNAAAGFVVAQQCDTLEAGVQLTKTLLKTKAVLATYHQYQQVVSRLG